MTEGPLQVTFLLVSGFQMASYVLAMDALRLANWRSGKQYFHCDIRTPDDLPAQANNAMVVAPDRALISEPLPDALFICAGFSAEKGCSPKVFKWLRELERHKAVLGGWDTGPLILAEAGLMDGRAMALHWQAVPAVIERYAKVEITSDSCQIDKRRFTSPGGVSTLDLILAFIARFVDPAVARMVAESVNQWSVTTEDRRSFSSSEPITGLLPTKIARVITLMKDEIEIPASIPSIAQRCGFSQRSLYRAFRSHLGQSPRTYYLGLRLERARELLRQSDFSITEIAAMTGFNSLSRLSQAFTKRFGESPMALRKTPSWLHVTSAGTEHEGLIRTQPQSHHAQADGGNRKV